MTTDRPGNSNSDADDSLRAEIQDFVAAMVHDGDYSVAKDGQINLKYAPQGFRPLIGAKELAAQNAHRRSQEILDQAKP
jgi:hypothetical protein